MQHYQALVDLSGLILLSPQFSTAARGFLRFALDYIVRFPLTSFAQEGVTEIYV